MERNEHILSAPEFVDGVHDTLEVWKNTSDTGAVTWSVQWYYGFHTVDVRFKNVADAMALFRSMASGRTSMSVDCQVGI